MARLTRHATSVARTPPMSAAHLFPRSRLAPLPWRTPAAATARGEDFVLAWPSSAIPRRGLPGVRAHFSIDVHPPSSPTRARGHVGASYEYPFELLLAQPAPTVQRRSRGGAAQRGGGTSDDWPVSPPPPELAVPDSYIYEWPSSLATRAPRPRIADESYIYDWPSSAPILSKVCPTHVMTWKPRR